MTETHPSLDFFIVIAKHKSLTKAAGELFVTQQNLSAYLKRLEDYYQIPIFTRKPKFELTDFGKGLLDCALRIQGVYQQIDSLAKSFSEEFELRLGCRSSQPTDFVTLFPFAEYQKSHPHVRFSFTEFSNSEGPKAVEAGEMDFAVTSYRVPLSKKLTCVTLSVHLCYAMLHKDLIMAHFPNTYEENIQKWKNGVALAELRGVPYFRLTRKKNHPSRDRQEQYLRDHDLLGDMLGECFSRNGALTMCRMGLCYFVTADPEPESDDFFCFPVTDPPEMQNLYCYTNPNLLINPYLREFWDMICSISVKSQNDPS